MPEFYTADRTASLYAGQVLEVDMDFTGRPIYELSGYFSRDDIEDLVKKHYPKGLSPHGKNYLLEPHLGDQGVIPAPVIEMTVEGIRKESFADLPSRFQSVFGCSTVSDCQAFMRTYWRTVVPIFRVSCDEYFTADMDLLKTGYTLLRAEALARKYWRGEAGPKPFWESLLVPPVHVLDRVA